MRYTSVINVGGLLLIGLFLGLGNLWITLARSTIPLALNDVVAEKRRLAEKVIGVDDVCLLDLQSGKTLHVDAPMFEAVVESERIQKEAWSPVMSHDRQRFDLEWSEDFQGMLWVMPGSVLLLAMLAVVALRSNADVTVER